jgi:ubiquinone/menaquinone biosynthesis C-methylase UbiE
LSAIDFRTHAIKATHRRFAGVDVCEADATELPFEHATFDFVALFTVFSSVSRQMRLLIAREVHRVLKPSGAVLWYDMRFPNPANTDVAAVARQHVGKLFGGYDGVFESATLIPQLARHLPARQVLFPVLYALPFLRTHWLAVLKKPSR